VPSGVAALRGGSFHVAQAFSPQDATAALLWRRLGGGPVVFSPAEPLRRETMADRRLSLRLLERAIEDSDAVVAPTEESRAALWRWLSLDVPLLEPSDNRRLRAPLPQSSGVADVSDAPVTVAVVSWNTRTCSRGASNRSLPRSSAAALTCGLWTTPRRTGRPTWCASGSEWAHLVASSENLGFGRAINLVARETSSEWLATANADVALRPGALEAMLAAGERDAGAGAIAPRLVLPAETPSTRCSRSRRSRSRSSSRSGRFA